MWTKPPRSHITIKPVTDHRANKNKPEQPIKIAALQVPPTLAAKPQPAKVPKVEPQSYLEAVTPLAKRSRTGGDSTTTTTSGSDMPVDSSSSVGPSVSQVAQPAASTASQPAAADIQELEQRLERKMEAAMAIQQNQMQQQLQQQQAAMASLEQRVSTQQEGTDAKLDAILAMLKKAGPAADGAETRSRSPHREAKTPS